MKLYDAYAVIADITISMWNLDLSALSTTTCVIVVSNWDIMNEMIA